MENNYWQPDNEFKKENRRSQRRVILKEVLLLACYIAAISLFVAGVKALAEWFFSR